MVLIGFIYINMRGVPAPLINSNYLPMENESTNRPPSPSDKDEILEIGHLLLQLEQLHKLGLKALQLASLIHQLTELVQHTPSNPDKIIELTEYCKVDGIRCVLASHDVMLLMQGCIEEIRDYYKSRRILVDDDVAEAASETAKFISDLYNVLDLTIKRITKIITETPKISKNADHSKHSESFNLTALRAMEVGRKSLIELEESTAEFNLICANFTSWIEKSAVSTHEGGRLKIYWPPNF